MIENRKIKLTKQALSDALIEILKEKHISEITVSELCLKADINRATFYKYYKSPFDLLNEIESGIAELFSDALESILKKNTNPNITQVLETLLTYIRRNHNYIDVLMNDEGNLSFRKKMSVLIHDKTRDYFRTIPHNSNEISAYIINGSIALIQVWIKNEYNISPKHLANLVIGFALRIIGDKVV